MISYRFAAAMSSSAVTPELSKTSDGANSHREDAASQSFAQLLRQDRQYRAFRRYFSLLERCLNTTSGNYPPYLSI
jgi:hypothetical protein